MGMRTLEGGVIFSTYNIMLTACNNSREGFFMQKFKVGLVTAIVVFCFLVPAKAESMDSGEVAKLLTKINKTSYGDRIMTNTRFKFLVNRLVETCSWTPEHTGDVLVAVYGQLKDIGLDDGLLNLSNDLHGLARRVYSLGTNSKASTPKCEETFATYVVLRKNGYGSQKAIDAYAKLVQRMHVMGSMNRKK